MRRTPSSLLNSWGLASGRFGLCLFSSGLAFALPSFGNLQCPGNSAHFCFAGSQTFNFKLSVTSLHIGSDPQPTRMLFVKRMQHDHIHIYDHGIVASVFTGRSCDCSNPPCPPGPRVQSSSWLPGSTKGSDKGKLRHLGVPPQGILLCTPGVWVDQASSHDLSVPRTPECLRHAHLLGVGCRGCWLACCGS